MSKSAQAREDESLGKRIEEIHRSSRVAYGAPRIHAELQEEGERVGRKRVASFDAFFFASRSEPTQIDPHEVAGPRGLDRRLIWSIVSSS